MYYLFECEAVSGGSVITIRDITITQARILAKKIADITGAPVRLFNRHGKPIS